MTKMYRIKRKDIPELVKKFASFDMPRAEGWLCRYLYDNGCEIANDDGCRGFILRRDDGTIGGYQCIIPWEVYWLQERIPAYQLAFLGADRDIIGGALELMDATSSYVGEALVYGNSLASQKPLRLFRDYLGFREGPSVCEQSNYALHDDLSMRELGPYSYCVQHCFEEHLFRPFWNSFLQANNGIITSRRPEILRSLYDGALLRGVLVLITALDQSGLVVGYILLRRYPAEDGRYRYQTSDWCSIGGDRDCLRGLLLFARRYAFQHNAWKIEYNGAPPNLFDVVKEVLPETLHLKRQTFVYRALDDRIRNDLSVNRTGWFFGPYDGDRGVGHGMYMEW